MMCFKKTWSLFVLLVVAVAVDGKPGKTLDEELLEHAKEKKALHENLNHTHPMTEQKKAELEEVLLTGSFRSVGGDRGGDATTKEPKKEKKSTSEEMADFLQSPKGSPPTVEAGTATPRPAPVPKGSKSSSSSASEPKTMGPGKEGGGSKESKGDTLMDEDDPDDETEDGGETGMEEGEDTDQQEEDGTTDTPAAAPTSDMEEVDQEEMFLGKCVASFVLVNNKKRIILLFDSSIKNLLYSLHFRTHGRTQPRYLSFSLRNAGRRRAFPR